MKIYPENIVDFCKNNNVIKISVTKDSSLVELREKLLSETNFLDGLTKKVPLAIRVYCVLNNIHSIPKCALCENVATYKKDYPQEGFAIYCSPICSRADKTIDKSSLKLLMDKDWLYDQRINHKKSFELIGQELGCSEIPVKKWIKVHGIPNVRYNESNSHVMVKLRDKEWLYEQHKVQRKKCREIAKEIGTTHGTVSMWLSKHEIESNSGNSYDRKFVRNTKPQQEIKCFIETFYKGIIEVGIRRILNGRELDIYLPEKKFAIEYNGVTFHTFKPDEFENKSLRKGPEYHLSKTEECLAQDIQLIHIWSSSWKTKKDIWKSIIKTKLGFVDRKIFARKCKICEISVHEKNTFLDENHLQGKDKSKIKYGMFYDDELVAVMTFNTPRYNSNYDWELVRFSVKKNISVVGAFSKFIKHFYRNNCGSIISYANRLYSRGDVYIKNGFKLIKVNKPNYWYVAKNSEDLLHRSNFTKKRLGISGEITEEQEMFERGYSKIFDCGTLTFVLGD